MPYPAAACRGMKTFQPGGPSLASPSITVTTQGEDQISAVAEVFSVSGGTDEVVDFSDGSDSGSITFDAGGLITNDPVTPPGGYGTTVGGTGQTSVSFLATSAGSKADMAKTSGGGGSVTVDTQGADATPGVAEVVAISFDGATGGTIRISGSDPIAWNADAAAVEAALEAALGEGVTVTGSNGEFEVTYDNAGAKTDLTITENLLTI